jgi:Nif-specific regulatory protein
MIIDSLKNTRGNIKKAAELIGTTVRKFAYKAGKYNVEYKDYR